MFDLMHRDIIDIPVDYENRGSIIDGGGCNFRPLLTTPQMSNNTKSCHQVLLVGNKAGHLIFLQIYVSIHCPVFVLTVSL